MQYLAKPLGLLLSRDEKFWYLEIIMTTLAANLMKDRQERMEKKATTQKIQGFWKLGNPSLMI